MSMKPGTLCWIILEWADDNQPEPVEYDLSREVKKSWDRFEGGSVERALDTYAQCS